jgi:hypothetical protein
MISHQPRSLRPWLAVAFMVAAALFVLAWRLAHRPGADRLAGEVEALGGSVGFEGQGTGRALVAVDLHGAAIDDAWLARLEGHHQLRRLDLGGTPLTGEGLAHLSGLTRLEELNLTGTRVTDAGLAHLAALARLRELGLGATRITDAGLAHLKGLAALRRLNLFGTRVTAAGVEELRRALPAVDVQTSLDGR